MSEYDEFNKSLESYGESEVRAKLSQGAWASKRKGWAEDWLQNRESLRMADRDERGLILSEEANRIARSALDVAKKSKTISIIAIIVSVLVAIGSVFYSYHRQ